MGKEAFTVLIPRQGEPPCACGQVKVAVYTDAPDALIDNMGCELGLEFIAGPFCPRCEAEALDRSRQVRRSRPPGKEEQS